MKIRIAIVEDEPMLREELAFQLRHMGFSVNTFENAQQFYRWLAVEKFDVVILDIGLAGEDGLSICAHLREHDRDVVLIFVTARALRDDRLTGLKAGADAYLTKPVDIDELNLVIQRLVERSASGNSEKPQAVPAAAEPAPWRIDAERGCLHAPDHCHVLLTLNEVRLLSTLLGNPGQNIGNPDLAKALGLLPDEYNKHRVEVIISRLREKVLRETGKNIPIKTIRGVGYRFFG